MESDLKRTAATVFAGVLENLAFMFMETPEERDLPSGTPPYVEARMTFVGPFEGALTLAAPEAMCPELAANVLGLDPDDEFVRQRPGDSLKELLNVTCGNLLSTLAGDEPIFDLTVPELHSLSEEEWAAILDAPEAMPFIVDEYPVVLRCFINKQP